MTYNSKYQERILSKLEWPLLVSKLASHAQSEEGQEDCESLSPFQDPGLNISNILERWDRIIPLRDLIRSGYKAPIGNVRKMYGIFKGAEKGMIFEGDELRLCYELLLSAKKVSGFLQNFSNRSIWLQSIRGRLQSCTSLYTSIEKSVGPDGKLLDSASEELQTIRKQKASLRKRIEENLQKLMLEPPVSDYLQDNFFTVRNDKYVIPMRLDGRGRVKGTIVDTSNSGQTLLIEPISIVPLNEMMQELDVAEKLEIVRIFRDLSAGVATELDALKLNYSTLIELDRLTAEAALAQEMDAGKIKIAVDPSVNLLFARHPLIVTPSGKSAEPNTISLDQNQSILVVSGPNAGGKTVVLKTVGLLQLMLKSGLLIPADESSSMSIFKNVYVEMGDSQNITANLSTFSGHIFGLKPILENATSVDLVLLDELATGTEPNTGAAIARAILENLAEKKVTTIATTHFDALKSLAISDHRYRNASMEYAEATYRPTYRLILDVPGQSYGLEVAEQMGLDRALIERARTIRGLKMSDLDEAVIQLNRMRTTLETEKKQLEEQLIAAQQSKFRWEQECKLLEEQRLNASRHVAAKLEDQVGALKSEFQEAAEALKKVVKEVRHGHVDVEQAITERKKTESKLTEFDKTISQLSEAGLNTDLPGRAAVFNELKEKLDVYVLPVRREGQIVKVPTQPNESIEVQVGIVKLRVSLQDLRITRGPSGNHQSTTSDSSHKKRISSTKVNHAVGTPFSPQNGAPSSPEMVPQTATNTIDLRGMDSDSATSKALQFIDKCLLRGEYAVVLIHGNGGDRLKTSIRMMLKSSCPYDVSFRPGLQNEGGDGVTIVKLQS
ncbi:MAG: Smr/MutS family protein [Proteobacteria bacterium]|nr:Smr/MutS family protein [Pseudomonadota bacterium]